MPLAKAIFLDRDGVLNRSVIRDGRPHPPASMEELVIPAEVPEALQRLREAGYLLVCVTNQPDVARGTQTRDAVEAINDHLLAELGLDAIEVCYEDGDHPRRKPNCGMLTDAAERMNIDLTGSMMVGDRWKDVEAGRRARCRTVFIKHDYQERPAADPHAIVSNLSEAADWILANSRGD